MRYVISQRHGFLLCTPYGDDDHEGAVNFSKNELQHHSWVIGADQVTILDEHPCVVKGCKECKKHARSNKS